MDQHTFEAQLNTYDNAYDAGNPLISDEQYDILVHEYQLLYGDYKKKGIQRDQPLPMPAPSLDKIKTLQDVEKWNTTYPGCKIVMDKIDGYSVLVSYTSQGVTLYTHSDASTGSNISHLLPFLRLPSLTIKQGETLVVRGEMAITLRNFDKYQNYTSPRNIISQLNAKNVDHTMLHDFDFLAFQLLYRYDDESTSRFTIEQQLQQLSKLGFDVVTGIHKVNDVIYEQLVDWLTQPCDYLRDGLVLAQCEIEDMTTALPRNKIAFKIAGETRETTVTKVEWNASKRQLLKPRVHYDPVFLDYANLAWVNGLNARFIVKHQIGVGTKILITRRGGINPYIEQVVQGTTASMPDEAYEWNDSQVDLVVPMNDTIRMKRLVVFFDTLGVKFMGLKTIEQLFVNELDTVEKIISASEVALKVGKLKSLSAKRIKQQIRDALQHVTMVKVMVGSCLFPGFGETKLGALLQTIPRLNEILLQQCDNNLRIGEIQQVEGIKNSADVIMEHLDEMIDFLNDTPTIKAVLQSDNVAALELQSDNVAALGLQTIKEIITPPVLGPMTNTTLQGQFIVFSGDKKLTNVARQKGAIVDANVTKRTTLLVVEQVGTMNNKEKTCRQKGIPVMGLKEFKKLYF